MNIQVLSNLNGNLPQVKECDLLIINGNISPVYKQSHRHLMEHWLVDNFVPWIVNNPAKNVVYVPGSYDIVLSPKNKSHAKLLKSILSLVGNKLTIPIGSKNSTIVGFPYVVDDTYLGYGCNKETFIKKLNELPENIKILICNTDIDCDEFKTYVEEKKPKLVITNSNRDKPKGASKHMDTTILRFSYTKSDFETPFGETNWRIS